MPLEGSPTRDPSKKRKSDFEALGSLVHVSATNPPADPSWRKHCKVVISAIVEGPMKTAWDSNYPFNRVLNSVIPPGYPEKAAAMGFGPTMTTIKTYGLWSSIMAHLVEGSFKQAMEELEWMRKDLEGAKARVVSLQADVQKYADKKSMLEGKISRLSKEAKNSSARVKVLEGDLESVSKNLEVALLQLAEAQSLPSTERYETLRIAYEKLKLDTLSSFDSGFHTVVSQFRLLHPRLDLSVMDIDKIVVGDQLVDAPEDEEQIEKEPQQHVGDEVPFDSVSTLQGEVVADQIQEPPAANEVVVDEAHGAGVLNAEVVAGLRAMNDL